MKVSNPEVPDTAPYLCRCYHSFGMDRKFFHFEHPVCKASAIVVAGLYWSSVAGAYFAAQSAHDQLGFAYIPFLVLTFPRSSFLFTVSWIVSLISPSEFLPLFVLLPLSGINALAVYLVAERLLARLSDHLLDGRANLSSTSPAGAPR